jgi:2-oxoisovalerate dehydrogenase E1 component
VVVFLEPIALYPQRDRLAPGDGGWLRRYPPPGARLGLGSIGVHGDGRDVALVSYGNGRLLSEQSAADLAAAGIAARVIDLRWLAPLPFEALAAALDGAAHVLVVDECRRSGGPSEALMCWLAEQGIGPAARVTAEDSFIATGPAYAATLPSRAGIVAAARALVRR